VITAPRETNQIIFLINLLFVIISAICSANKIQVKIAVTNGAELAYPTGTKKKKNMFLL